MLLSRRPFKEGDDLVEGFSCSLGRLTAVAKGGRRKGSALLEPPVCIEARFRRGRTLDNLSQPNLLNPYSRVKRNLPALLTAGFLSRIFLASVPERDGDGRFYLLLERLLDALSENVEPALVGLWGQARLLYCLGVAPNLSLCSGCGALEVQGYSAPTGGLLCGGCYEGVGFALSAATIEFGRLLSERPLEDAFPVLESAFKVGLGRLYKEHFQVHLGLEARYFKRVLPERGLT